MNRYRYIVAEGMVIEHVAAEEQDDIDEPAADRHSVGREEERRALRVELRYVSGNGNEEELDKSQKRPFKYVSMLKLARTWTLSYR